MADYYMRVEAVGFDHTVYDTNDISTIRGGSFLALNAVKHLGEEFEKKGILKTITTGASVGLYRSVNGAAPETMKNETVSFLKNHTGGHLEFVVDVVDGSNMCFGEIHARLIEANQWSRMRRLTIPWQGIRPGAEVPCDVDGVRPGVIPLNNETISESVNFRKDKGRELRGSIYAEILGEKKETFPLEFTSNLEELSKAPAGPQKLDRKIAFIYIDGNKFGKLRESCGYDQDVLSGYDHTIQEKFRKPALEKILDHMKDDPLSLMKKDDPLSSVKKKEIRLETLLWGGDEIEWVVPAWKGLEILELFYSSAILPQRFGRDEKAYPLTHAAGVVFCHHSAPILHIRNLARDLAGMVKDDIKDIPEKQDEGDIFHYLVLESFDMLQGDLRTFVKKYYTPVDYKSLKIKGSELKNLIGNLKTVAAHYPRKKVYEMIDALRNGEDEEKRKKIIERGLSECPEHLKEDIRDAINAIADNRPERWFTIAELWDFINKEDVHDSL
jgi:hypothetical protein